MKRFGFIFFLVFLISCEETIDYNDGTIPLPGTIRFTDTLTIKTEVVQDTTIRTDLTDRVLLGSLYDSEFGKTSSSFYTTVTTSQVIRRDDLVNLIVDSVVLVLKPEGYYGDGTKLNSYQIAEVYEVIEDIPTVATSNTIGYNSSTSFDINPIPLGVKGFSSQMPNFGSQGPQLRIRLDPSVATRVLLNDTILSSQTIQKNLKGIYVKISNSTINTQNPNQGAINYFRIISDQSKISLYIRYGTSTPIVTEVKLPTGTSLNRRFNVFKHNYSTASAGLQARLASDTASTDYLYMSPMQGVKFKIEFPTLQNLNHPDSGSVVLNRAELIMPVDISQNLTLYPVPSSVNAYYYSNTGKIVFIKDLVPDFTNIIKFDGLYDKDNQRYRAVITLQLSKMMLGDINIDGFYFDVPVLSKHKDAARIVINSPSHPTNPMKLNLTFTRVKK